MSRSPVLRFAVGVVALVALSAGCSSNDDDNAAESTTTSSVAKTAPVNTTASTETTTSTSTPETTTSIPASQDAISVAVWVIVLLEVLIEQRTGVRVLGAFVLPIAVVLGLKATSARPGTLLPALASAWIWIHIALAMVGIAAFVFNFAGAIMYLLQERQLKTKRPGAFYYRLPSLQTLDRLTFRTLALGFPFLTTGLVLGTLWARAAWGSTFTFDPVAVLSFVAWLIYASTLAGRAAAGWHGRRAAYFSIVGFVALVLTLGAGLFLPGRHGS